MNETKKCISFHSLQKKSFKLSRIWFSTEKVLFAIHTACSKRALISGPEPTTNILFFQFLTFDVLLSRQPHRGIEHERILFGFPSTCIGGSRRLLILYVCLAYLLGATDFFSSAIFSCMNCRHPVADGDVGQDFLDNLIARITSDMDNSLIAPGESAPPVRSFRECVDVPSWCV